LKCHAGIELTPSPARGAAQCHRDSWCPFPADEARVISRCRGLLATGAVWARWWRAPPVSHRGAAARAGGRAGAPVNRRPQDRSSEAARQSDTRLRSAFRFPRRRDTLRTNSELFLRLSREALGLRTSRPEGALKEPSGDRASVDPHAPLSSAPSRRCRHSSREPAVNRRTTLRTQIETLAGGRLQLQPQTAHLCHRAAAARRCAAVGAKLTLRGAAWWSSSGLIGNCDFHQSAACGLRECACVWIGSYTARCTRPGDRRQDAASKKKRVSRLPRAPTTRSASSAQATRPTVETRVGTRVPRLLDQFERSPSFAVLFLLAISFLSGARRAPDCSRTALGRCDHCHALDPHPARSGGGYGWRSRRGASRGRDPRPGQRLYRRLGPSTDIFGRHGARLAGGWKAYNRPSAHSSAEFCRRRERFSELGVTADAPLAELRARSAAWCATRHAHLR